MTTVVVSPTASGDDGDQYTGDTFTTINATYVELATNKSATFVRFPGVTVPQGATVDSAVLAVVSSTPKTAEGTATMRCHASNNSPRATTGTDVAALTRTTASTSVTWQATAAGQTKTGSVTAPVQEIINRAGWVSGNALQIIFQTTNVPNFNFGFYTWDNGSDVPQLTIDYTAGGGGSDPARRPVVSRAAVVRSTRF